MMHKQAWLGVDRLRPLSLVGSLVLSVGATAEAQTGPRYPGAQWMQYASPEEAGYSSAGIAHAHAIADSLGSAAVLFVQDGAVVTAWGDITRPDNIQSITKSFQSALVGMAVEEGRIDLDATLEQLGIDDVPALTASERQARVRDLLTMRSGVLHSAVSAFPVNPSPEQERPAPGTVFSYTNWDVNALEAVFQQSTGASFPEAVEERLVAPLEMEDFNQGYVSLSFNPTLSRLPHPSLRLSTRDLARFGLLYLNRGRWGDRQIVPESWVAESTRPHVDLGPQAAFGYLWWIPQDGPVAEQGGFLASGTGSQTVIVLPKSNAVFVHRAAALGGGVNGRDAYRILVRILESRSGEAASEPRLVGFTPDQS